MTPDPCSGPMDQTHAGESATMSEIARSRHSEPADAASSYTGPAQVGNAGSSAAAGVAMSRDLCLLSASILAHLMHVDRQYARGSSAGDESNEPGVRHE